ncbi:enoyl-CoA delta isomerase 2 isoform X2 [Ixodes scapularis]|uniref:enoyl-CoA delta isomerase 2 isoform X2 n=1 Tax=Ixodes scapularis TaxID=6945 RepID=UPI001A9E4351|nr:enoyl-CoA delta isomerase 2 isoform X2 [Ixodes scapularis]
MLSLSRRALWNPSVRRASAALRPFSAASPAEKFNQAVKDLNNVPEEPSNDVKLQLYALFKQATVGKCNVAKPGTFDFVGKAKWDAWYKLGDMSQDDAQNEYAAIVTKLAGEKASGPAQSQEPATAASSGVEGLVTTFQDGAFTIRFNRPSKRNSITLEMYEEVIKLLKDAGQRDDVKFLVLTGTGEFFSSGNDLGNFAKQMQTGRSQLELAKEAAELVRRYVAEFINFPKPAMALINGPSIGVSCTILGLFDLVYASDKAFFQTPFTQLGLSPEGCSSYTFPRIMGIARACEVLMMNKQLSAKEAEQCGFVSKCFPDASFQEETQKKIQEMAKLPPKSLMHSKTLVRAPILEDLHKANNLECERLVERFTSEEMMKAVMAFFQGKGKL